MVILGSAKQRELMLLNERERNTHVQYAPDDTRI